MSANSISLKLKRRSWSKLRILNPHDVALPLRIAAVICGSFILSFILVFAVELLLRGSLQETVNFLFSYDKPAWTTIILCTCLLTFFDAIFGRLFLGFLIISPLFLTIAGVAKAKSLYLGDPLYPSDFLYARQIFDLMPLLVSERPAIAFIIALLLVATLTALAFLIVFGWKNFNSISWRGRAVRLVIALPPLIWFGIISDYASYSWTRDQLRVRPMMWDQKANYAHNGFALAFILNVPMAKVFAPTQYSAAALNEIAQNSDALPAANKDSDKPDIIMIMSESFWDPTRLPNVTFNKDPIPTVRAAQSGHVFSPEFGGMTANVEFEALTGFTKAFLPTGSIPYQQYIREPLPSLASFFNEQGYTTLALHPFRQWFWNRGNIYKHFGFQRFLSEENLPPLEKRGTLASDAAIITQLISEADQSKEPFFFFAVSLQGHGPYAAGRYPDAEIEAFTDAGKIAKESISSFAQGAYEADQSLKRLMDWASQRERETIIVFFGDHLPPLGPAYVDTGFMQKRVASRTASAEEMIIQHETPLIVWSNKSGTQNTGTISPAFLPLKILNLANMTHPYYTGFLAELHDAYPVIDNHLIIAKDGSARENWQQQGEIPTLLRQFQLLQYDMMFGYRYGVKSFFPAPSIELSQALIAAE